LRRLVAVGLLAPVAALAACSGESPVTAEPDTFASATGPAASATAPPTGGASSGTTHDDTGSVSPTTTPAAVPKRTDHSIDARLKDPVLGHSLRVTKMSRNVPWPAGNPVSAANFEIIGLYVEVAAGDRYSATVAPSMFSLRAAPSIDQIRATSEFDKVFSGSLTGVTKRGETRRGWVFFKMDKGAGKIFVFGFHRPAYVVTTTNTVIPPKAYGAVIKL
jgi:hypothetical protein